MAQLALAVVGAALSPAGYAAVGWTIGQVVGQMLFPGSLPDQVGPRVGDLRAQQSQYGAAIPILYGTSRVAGNVIWSTPLLETASSQSAGGKGGPSQTQTTYSYRVSMAILLGRGPMLAVRRIWANGKLIYDVSATASLSTVSASTRLAAGIEFYPGSETQLPDPTMEAYLGIGNVPAYRGQAYIVFSDLQLADYGNARPNISVEVVASGTVSSAASYVTLPGVAGTQYQAIAHDGEMLIALDRGAPQRVSRSRDDGLTWTALSGVTAAFANGLDITYSLGLWIVVLNDGLAFSEDGYAWTLRTSAQGAGQGAVRAIAANASRAVILSLTDSAWTSSSDGRTWVAQSVVSHQWRGIIWSGTHFVAFADTGQIARSQTGLPGSWDYTTIGVAGSNWISIASSGSSLVIADTANNRFARSTDHGLTWSIVSVLAAYRCVVWAGEYYVAMRDGATANAHARSRDGVAWEYFAQTENPGVQGICAKGGIVYGVNNTSVLGAQRVTILRFDITTPSAVPLSAIVSDICTQSGLVAGDIDVASLASISVDGYAIGQRMSARSALETLQRAFAFDLVESDGKITARVRGGAPVMAIQAADLGAVTAGDSAADDLSLVRQQESELPADVSVVFPDRDADYQQNTQRATRATTLSTQQTAVELAVVLSPSRARAIAEMLLYDAWTQRLRFTMRLSRAYAALEPADVVTLSRNDASYTMRITSKTESRSGVIQFEAVAEAAAVYTQSAVGGAGPAGQTAVQAAPSTLWVPLDVPALRDQDTDSGFYAAAAGVTSGWRGASVFRSADGGATYDESGAMVSEAAIGFTIGSLWNQNFHPNVFDEGTLVNVELQRGALVSLPEATVLEGANYLLIGSEIVQFKSAVLYAANTYQLSGLLRGRRGTEWAMSGHAASGERVVLLTPSTLRRFVSDLSAARLYKPVTFGRTIQQTAAQTFTYAGVNQLPFAPVHLGAGRNAANDITLTWLRRSRQGVTLPWNYDPPLAETSLLYDVEIWNSTFSTLRRTFASLTAETVNYTAAQQAADSGGVLTSYGVRVWQRNAVLGRGYVLQGVV